MKKILLLNLVLVSVLGFISCGDDDNDTTKPVIEVISPSNGTTFAPGDIIKVEANFSDNESLASCKINIHYGGDGHTHTKSISSDDSVGKEFTYNRTIDTIVGKKDANIILDIDIPLLIDEKPIKEGKYHLGVLCFDSSGNENHQYVDIIVGEE